MATKEAKAEDKNPLIGKELRRRWKQALRASGEKQRNTIRNFTLDLRGKALVVEVSGAGTASVGLPRYALLSTRVHVRGFRDKSARSRTGTRGSSAGNSFDTASRTITATGSAVRFC